MLFQKIVAKTVFKLFKWEIVGEIPIVSKYVMVLAPHTSLLDMVMGKLYNWAIDMKASIMVKKEFFFFPMGLLISKWGGIPIDRKHAGGIIQQMTEEFSKADKLVLSITPEGTRSPNVKWKTGFHRIATAANVPVYLALIDFKTKRIGFVGEHKLTDNVDKDIAAIKERYRGMEGFRRSKFVL